MKKLELKQDVNGQWLYRIVDANETVIVRWQYGPFGREEAVAEARERFCFDSVSETKIEAEIRQLKERQTELKERLKASKLEHVKTAYRFEIALIHAKLETLEWIVGLN